ncbi:MAG: hydantoinase/oxoprolinase family protein [Vulcanimicrobiaceae bacterium]
MGKDWRIGIDIGGTFTDLLAVDETGVVIACKVPTKSLAPHAGALAALDAFAAQNGTGSAITSLAHATTIATNALLGQLHLELPRIALLTTEGFADIIEIGRQNRSRLYDLFVTRPRPLVARENRIGVRERMGYTGTALIPLDDAEISRIVTLLSGRNDIDVVAVCLLHAYANDTHERRLADAVSKALPNIPVVRSCEVDPQYREYERFSTTLVNAALLPIVRRYLDDLIAGLRARDIHAPLFVMRSNGGTSTAEQAARRPAALIESGPASGTIAAAELARSRGIERIIAFDMGGTTAKAGTVIDGRVEIATEFEAASATKSGRAVKGSGYPVRFPFVDLAEISAGGGTIAWLDEGARLRVGPVSAGSDPGPACYGTALHATVTDADVVLGRLNRTHLLDGAFPIQAERSRAAIATLAQPLGLGIEAAAAGIIAVIDAQMAQILRIVTVERGLDPRDFTLVAYGGNGPLHACALAQELAVSRILVPERPGLFAAAGLLIADLRADATRSILRACTQIPAIELRAVYDELETLVRSDLQAQGTHDRDISVTYSCDARYRGQSFELALYDMTTPHEIAEAFHRSHATRYGYAVSGEPVEIVTARATAIGRVERSPARSKQAFSKKTRPPQIRNVWIDEGYVDVPVYRRSELPIGAQLDGPTIIEQYDASIMVLPRWRVGIDDDACVIEALA